MRSWGEGVRYSKYLDSCAKRWFDIAVSLVLILPAIAAIGVLGVIILICEGRPVFFIQRRAGKNGKIFLMPKLRTLRTDANPYKSSPKSEDDPLVTMSGKFLRRHRLDELPQLFSVLTGRMSVVGPRPELGEIVAGYKTIHRKRLAARPGVTGLWQIMGDRRVNIHEDIKYDLYYLRKASLLLDIKILVITIPFVLDPSRKNNTYEDRVYTYNVSLSK